MVAAAAAAAVVVGGLMALRAPCCPWPPWATPQGLPCWPQTPPRTAAVGTGALTIPGHPSVGPLPSRTPAAPPCSGGPAREGDSGGREAPRPPLRVRPPLPPRPRPTRALRTTRATWGWWTALGRPRVRGTWPWGLPRPPLAAHRRPPGWSLHTLRQWSPVGHLAGPGHPWRWSLRHLLPPPRCLMQGLRPPRPGPQVSPPPRLRPPAHPRRRCLPRPHPHPRAQPPGRLRRPPLCRRSPCPAPGLPATPRRRLA